MGPGKYGRELQKKTAREIREKTLKKRPALLPLISNCQQLFRVFRVFRGHYSSVPIDAETLP